MEIENVARLKLIIYYLLRSYGFLNPNHVSQTDALNQTVTGGGGLLDP